MRMKGTILYNFKKGNTSIQRMNDIKELYQGQVFLAKSLTPAAIEKIYTNIPSEVGINKRSLNVQEKYTEKITPTTAKPITKITTRLGICFVECKTDSFFGNAPSILSEYPS